MLSRSPSSTSRSSAEPQGSADHLARSVGGLPRLLWLSSPVVEPDANRGVEAVDELEHEVPAHMEPNPPHDRQCYEPHHHDAARVANKG